MSVYVDSKAFRAAVGEPTYDAVTWDTVRKTTVVKGAYVEYTVDVEGWHSIRQEIIVYRVFEVVVQFGKDVSHRAGGYAFVDAAAEQEKVATLFVEHLRAGS